MSSVLGAIHATRRNLGLDDDTARALYERETGERSLRAMTPGQQVQVLQALRRAEGPRSLEGPYAKKVQALWISAWNLGLVQHREDAALLGFIRRQTGIERTEFLRDAAQALKVVEALKSWMARTAGVAWGEHAEPLDDVIAAQVAILGLATEDDDDGRPALQAYRAWRAGELARHEQIEVSRLFGALIRKQAG